VKPYTVGLTGGIGSGKSAVAGLFARHGVAVIDTDDIATSSRAREARQSRRYARHSAQG